MIEADIIEVKAKGKGMPWRRKTEVERHETAVGLGLESGCSVSSKTIKIEIVVEGAKRSQ